MFSSICFVVEPCQRRSACRKGALPVCACACIQIHVASGHARHSITSVSFQTILTKARSAELHFLVQRAWGRRMTEQISLRTVGRCTVASVVLPLCQPIFPGQLMRLSAEKRRGPRRLLRADALFIRGMSNDARSRVHKSPTSGMERHQLLGARGESSRRPRPSAVIVQAIPCRRILLRVREGRS